MHHAPVRSSNQHLEFGLSGVHPGDLVLVQDQQMHGPGVPSIVETPLRRRDIVQELPGEGTPELMVAADEKEGLLARPASDGATPGTRAPRCRPS